MSQPFDPSQVKILGPDLPLSYVKRASAERQAAHWNAINPGDERICTVGPKTDGRYPLIFEAGTGPAPTPCEHCGRVTFHRSTCPNRDAGLPIVLDRRSKR